MSNITDSKTRMEAALQKYGEKPEGLTSLWADSELVDELNEVVTEMAGQVQIDGHLLPRYGVLSLILHTTPCYVYGHPRLKEMCRTAFTDGVHTFICDDFFRDLMDDVEDSNYTEYGIEPLILHELMHKMLNHVDRLKQFPKDLANKAADLSINTKLSAAFPEMEWCKSLRETGLGFKPGDKEKYIGLSEESIARELLSEEMKQRQKQSGKDKKGQQGQPGQGDPQSGGQPGKGQPGQGQPGQGDPQSGGQPSQGGDDGQPNDKFGGDGDEHLISMKDLIEALEDAGLDNVKDLLGLPDSDDAEEIGRFEEENQDRQHEAIQQAIAQSKDSNGKYPGQHIVDAAAEYMKNFGKGKLTWKLAVREAVLGDSMKFKGSYESFSDIAYVDEVSDELGTSLYLPVELPHKSEETVMVLIDTSGSVSTEDIRTFLTEVFELKTASENMGDNASEVLVIPADTVLRGEVIEITDENVDEMLSQGVKMFGRGGTDLGHSLKEAMKLPEFKEKKIRSVVYFTDLFDRPPKYSELGVPDGTSIVFVAAPSTHSAHQEEFAKAVESYARVVSIKEGVEVDLEDAKNMSVSPSKRMKA